MPHPPTLSFHIYGKIQFTLILAWVVATREVVPERGWNMSATCESFPRRRSSFHDKIPVEKKQSVYLRIFLEKSGSQELTKIYWTCLLHFLRVRGWFRTSWRFQIFHVQAEEKTERDTGKKIIFAEFCLSWILQVMIMFVELNWIESAPGFNVAEKFLVVNWKCFLRCTLNLTWSWKIHLVKLHLKL